MQRRTQLVIAGAAVVALIIGVFLAVQTMSAKSPYADIGTAGTMPPPPAASTTPTSGSTTASSGVNAEDLGAALNKSAKEATGTSADALGLDDETAKTLSDPKNRGKRFILQKGADGKMTLTPGDLPSETEVQTGNQ